MADEDLIAEEATLREIFEQSRLGSTPRDLLLKSIVKQALAGAPWLEVCAEVMKQRNITPEEVEAIVVKVRKPDETKQSQTSAVAQVPTSTQDPQASPKRKAAVPDTSYRFHVLEVIAYQALAGVEWRDSYQSVLEKQGIKPEEVQAVVNWIIKESTAGNLEIRDQVFTVIVRQALLGADWQQLCATAMNDQNIKPEEVAAVVEWLRNTHRDAEGELGLKPPETAPAYFKRARVYFDSEQYDKALKDFDRTLSLDKRHRLAYINRGILHGRVERFDAAVEDFTKAIELVERDLIHSYLYRGIAHVNSGRNEKAIEDFEKVINIDPNAEKAYYNRGIAYFNLRRFQEAILDFSRAVELDPDYRDAYCNRASAHFELGNLQKAIDDYSKIIEVHADDVSAYEYRATCFEKLGDIEKAKEDRSAACRARLRD